MVRKYPIGLQSFRKIREDGFLYVDKSEIIHRLVTSGSYYFLSRPRRFGKSLLLDTINELFSGSRELFKGLWIEDQWNWERKHPVIHLRISQINYQKLGLYEALFKELDRVASEQGVTLEEKDLKDKFRELIEKAAAKEKLVILIDEYDKPIVDYLDDREKVEENRSVFKSFYSVLKDADRYIRFLMLTGVSRFSKVSIFSDLNNLEDITIGRNFNSLVGITQQELEMNFQPEITLPQKDVPDIQEEIRNWYNGYSWGGAETLYNPFSLLSFMKQGEFRNFWYGTGSPTFLIKQLKNKKIKDAEGIRLSEQALSDFNTDDPEPGPLLFQTGYVTIKNPTAGGQVYELGYPNREVKASLLDGLLNAYRDTIHSDSLALVTDLQAALAKADMEGLVKALNSLLGHIPCDHWRSDTESIFNIVTFLTFKLAGVDVYTEVHSNRGRCDVMVKNSDYIYAIELKLDGTAEEALKQVLTTGYLQPYEADKRKKIALGISFSSTERKVVEYGKRELS